MLVITKNHEELVRNEGMSEDRQSDPPGLVEVCPQCGQDANMCECRDLIRSLSVTELSSLTWFHETHAAERERWAASVLLLPKRPSLLRK